MQYYYSNEQLPSHWHDIVTMVEENYRTQDNANDVFLLGCYMHYGVEKVVKQIYSEKTYNKVIAYQLEPLVSNHWWTVDRIIEKLKGADEVWDYDLDNIEILAKHGIKAEYRPFVYTHNLKRINNLNDKTIDVLFYGTFTDYRYDIVKNMIYYPSPTVKELNHIKFVWIHNMSGDLLDDYISKSKIILNLNPYDGETRQQQSRIFYALINEKCVLSQRSNRNYFGDNIYEFSNKYELKEKLTVLLQNDKWADTSNLTFGKI